MRQSDRVKLFFGPYRTPRFKLGTKVDCAVRGELVIVGLSDGRIPWRLGMQGARAAAKGEAVTKVNKQATAMRMAFLVAPPRERVVGLGLSKSKACAGNQRQVKLGQN